MKSFIFLVSISISAMNAQASGFEYECNCFPAKGEKRSVCNGQENLNVKISGTGKTIKTEMGDYEWEVSDSFNSVRRNVPTPKGYNYYETTSGGGTYSIRPNFLVDRNLNNGGSKLQKCAKGGFVRAIFDDVHNDEVSVVNYVCCAE